MNTLIWVYDSPFSRCIKWLFTKHCIEHDDYILTWDEMASDPLLANNPKRQVPTVLAKDLNEVKYDSLLIAMDYLPANWHQTLDAKLFRLADSDVEAAIIFLFRANLLKKKFGESEQSQLMLDAGVNTYKHSVDYLLDHLLTGDIKAECNYGAVLLHSTLLAAISLSIESLKDYRRPELGRFVQVVESDDTYQQLIATYQGKPSNELPFAYHNFS